MSLEGTCWKVGKIINWCFGGLSHWWCNRGSTAQDQIRGCIAFCRPDPRHPPMNMCITHILATTRQTALYEAMCWCFVYSASSIRSPCTHAHLQLRNKALQRENGLNGVESSSTSLLAGQQLARWTSPKVEHYTRGKTFFFRSTSLVVQSSPLARSYI